MLFGHQNDDNDQTVPEPTVVSTASLNPLAVDPDTGVSLPVAPDTLDATQPAEAPVLNQPQTSAYTISSPPASAPAMDDIVAPTPAPMPVPEPMESMPEPPVPEGPSDDPAPFQPSDDLIALKQQALAQLSPLVGQLDQTPEEKFRTTMMMIQSTDNQTLIQSAYDAAQQITDEKARAQALLDVINEINYFTTPRNT